MSTPPSFEAGGRRYTVSLTLGSVRAVRTAGYDLLALDQGTPPLAVRLRTDPLVVGEILWAILSPQITANGLTEQAFCDSLTATELSAAYAALVQALTDFFRQLGRPDLATVLDRTGALLAMAASRAAETLAATDLDRIVREAIQTPGAQSPPSPPPPALTPGPGPGENSRTPPTPSPGLSGHRPASSPRSPTTPEYRPA